MNNNYNNMMIEKYGPVIKRKNVIKFMFDNFDFLFLTIFVPVMFLSILCVTMFEIIEDYIPSFIILKTMALIILIIDLFFMSTCMLERILVGIVKFIMPSIISISQEIMNLFNQSKIEYEILYKMPASKEELEKIGCKTQQDVYMFYRLSYIYEWNNNIYSVRPSYEICEKEEKIMEQFKNTIPENNPDVSLGTLSLRYMDFFDINYCNYIINEYQSLREYLSEELLETFDEIIKKIEKYINEQD